MSTAMAAQTEYDEDVHGEAASEAEERNTPELRSPPARPSRPAQTASHS